MAACMPRQSETMRFRRSKDCSVTRVILLNARSATSPTSSTMTTKQRPHSLSAAYWQKKLSQRAIRTTKVMSCSIWLLWIGHNKEKHKWCGRPGPPCRVSSRRSPTFARNAWPRGSGRSFYSAISSFRSPYQANSFEPHGPGLIRPAMEPWRYSPRRPGRRE